MTTAQRDDDASLLSPELGETRVGRWRIPTSALRAYTMVFALIVIWLFFQWNTRSELYPYGLFLHPVNLANLLKQMSVTGVLAVGMLLVIVARQIDLSIGSVVGLAGGVAAMSQGWGLLPSFAAAIAIGVLVGAFQGGLVAYANIPSFIVTLGGLLTWRGVILYLSKGETIPVRLPVFRQLGVALVTPASGWVLAAIAIVLRIWMTVRRQRARKRHDLAASSTAAAVLGIIVPSVLIVVFVYAMNFQGGVPLPVIVLLAVAVAGHFLTQSTTFGRYLYAIGSNPDAARLSGVNSRKHILTAFALLGGLWASPRCCIREGSEAHRRTPGR